jgi:hypothetical protein
MVRAEDVSAERCRDYDKDERVLIRGNGLGNNKSLSCKRNASITEKGPVDCTELLDFTLRPYIERVSGELF